MPNDERVPLYYPTSTKHGGRKVYITKEFTFEAAHKLCQHTGKCFHLHGHTYKLLVTVSGYVCSPSVSRELDNLMVVDFSTLGNLIKDNIIEKHDHTFLNDLYGDNPTAEVICLAIYDKLKTLLRINLPEVVLDHVRLYETPTSYAEYLGED